MCLFIGNRHVHLLLRIPSSSRRTLQLLHDVHEARGVSLQSLLAFCSLKVLCLPVDMLMHPHEFLDAVDECIEPLVR